MIGSNIKRARKRMMLSQSELARLVGVSPQSVQQWETGVTQPKRNRIAKLAICLHSSSEEIEFGQQTNEHSKEENNNSVDVTINDLSQLEYQFLEAFRTLSPQKQKNLLLLVASVKEEQESTLDIAAISKQ